MPQHLSRMPFDQRRAQKRFGEGEARETTVGARIVACGERRFRNAFPGRSCRLSGARTRDSRAIAFKVRAADPVIETALPYR